MEHANQSGGPAFIARSLREVDAKVRASITRRSAIDVSVRSITNRNHAPVGTPVSSAASIRAAAKSPD
jgi:hypothetical protein